MKLSLRTVLIGSSPHMCVCVCVCVCVIPYLCRLFEFCLLGHGKDMWDLNVCSNK